MVISGIYSLAIMTWILCSLIKELKLNNRSKDTKMAILIQMPIWLYILATLLERLKTYG